MVEVDWSAPEIDIEKILKTPENPMPDPDTLGVWCACLFQAVIEDKISKPDMGHMFAVMARKIGAELADDDRRSSIASENIPLYREIAKEFRKYAMEIAKDY